jgi:surface antigen
MQKIKKIVKSKIDLFTGQEEIRGNQGFKESWFRKIMRKAGFKRDHPWCAYAAESVWVEAYKEIGAYDTIKELEKLFSPSAVQTFKNFAKAGYPISKIPEEGAIVVWQTVHNGKYHWTGHIGVVYSTRNSDNFIAGEGNTNKGKSREGYIYWKHPHNVSREMNRKNGLKLIGFIPLKHYIYENKSKKTESYGY